MQTTEADLIAGWRVFRAWSRRFKMSIFAEAGNPVYGLYLAGWSQVPNIEENELEIREGASEQKIAFMKAYLSMVALESASFESDVKTILKSQGRLRAPHSLGFWFIQSDVQEFGAGGSSFFQGEEISIFCQNKEDVDFADICGIIPFDQIMVRKPVSHWDSHEVASMVDHIKRDLAFDGVETGIEASITCDLAYLTLLSPDRGLRG